MKVAPKLLSVFIFMMDNKKKLKKLKKIKILKRKNVKNFACGAASLLLLSVDWLI